MLISLVIAILLGVMPMADVHIVAEGEEYQVVSDLPANAQIEFVVISHDYDRSSECGDGAEVVDQHGDVLYTFPNDGESVKHFARSYPNIKTLHVRVWAYCADDHAVIGVKVE